jgi:20S proteasome alpha/beta subunit
MAMGLTKDNKEYPLIIGASDRMITAGNIEYEPPRSKISRITTYTVALSSGDVPIQAEVLNRTCSQFGRVSADNPDIYSVEEIADAYGRNLVDYKSQIIERTILRPIGFTWQTYRKGYPDETPSWFKKAIMRVFQDIDLPETDTIIAGVDETGAHLFVIDANGYSSRLDSIGFASIGAGESHAKSQFMFERHTPSKSAEDTLFLTYLAKRRAEVAQGVGKETDLFYISLKEGYVDLVEEQNALEKVYESIIRITDREIVKLKTLIPKIFK